MRVVGVLMVVVVEKYKRHAFWVARQNGWERYVVVVDGVPRARTTN